jgi:hypothetical protein
MNQPTPFEVLQQVDQFYQNAWDHLMLFATTIATIVGIVIPFLSYVFQKRFFKAEEATLSALIEKKSVDSHSKLIEITKKLVEEKAGEIQLQVTKAIEENRAKILQSIERLDKKVSRGEGTIFHLQTMVAVREKLYDVAFRSALTAMDEQSKCGDKANLRRVANTLVEDILPHLDKDGIKKLEDNGASAEKLLGRLKEITVDGDCVDLIETIRDSCAEARRRIKPAIPPKA